LGLLDNRKTQSNLGFKKMKRAAFTMLELVFVIVVIGILAAVAVPRLAATRDDAQIAKGRSDIAAIRSAIVSERQVRLLRGDSSYINQLDHAASTDEGVTIFDSNGTDTKYTILMYGITTKKANGHWMKTATGYTYQIMSQAVTFDYNNTTGTFTCNRSAAEPEGNYCKLLVD
jgi:general secretion pathway protein G